MKELKFTKQTSTVALVFFIAYVIYGIFYTPWVQLVISLAVAGIAYGMTDSYEVAVIVLGPSDLYKLVKEIGKFIQNARTLGAEAAKSFEGTIGCQDLNGFDHAVHGTGERLNFAQASRMGLDGAIGKHALERGPYGQSAKHPRSTRVDANDVFFVRPTGHQAL